MKLALTLALAIAAPHALPGNDWKLTPGGWGPIRMGMNRAQVEKSLDIRLEGDAFDNEGSCVELYSADQSLAGLFFMFEGGKLTRISATEPSAVATPRGIHAGSTVEQVRKAYDEGLTAEPHKYEGPPAEYLTFWLKPGKSGVRFETDLYGKVATIHAGTSSIQYVEGCA